MVRKRFLAILFSFLAVFLFISGCSQQPSDTNKADTAKQEQMETTNKVADKTDTETESPTADSQTDRPGNDAKKEDAPKGEVRKDQGQSKVLSMLKVHFIDVGQADSTLIEFSDGGEDYTILIDGGNWNRTNVVDYLRNMSVSEIDLAIATHPDADHIGQLDKVINQFDVGEVWMSGNTNTSRTFQRLLQAIDQQNVDYYEPRTGEEFDIGPLQIDVLYPKTISENDNEESISLKLTYGDVSFIFTGDAARNDELKMLQSGFNLDADILHLGHHGSNTSTHPSFLKAVSPSVAIYSAGVNNSYGHPHGEVVNLIKNSGAKLYGTDVHGTIIISTDGKTYNITTKKSGTVTSGSKGPADKKADNPPAQQKEPTPTPTPEPKPEPKPDKKPAPAINNNCININTASLQELQEIIHIGPARAEELINLRPFNSVDDLKRIKGIGPARLDDIKAQGRACVGG